MIELRRRVSLFWARLRSTEPTGVTAEMRRLIYLLWALLLLVGVVAVGALWTQAGEIDRLTLTVDPAFDANGQVLQAMTDAEAGLVGYWASPSPELLKSYHSAQARTMTALKVEDMLGQVTPHNAAGVALDKSLLVRQRLAVEQWWVFALGTEHAAAQGDRTVVVQSVALFDSFRRANAALGEHLKTERDEVSSTARTTAAAGMVTSIAVTLMALLAAIVLGHRSARSLSLPIIELRDTMTRQREGELGARAREDQGSLELRSLAADFNTLTENAADIRARMVSLADASLAFGQELSLEALLTQIVQSAREVLGVRYAALGVLDATGTGLSDFVTVGLSPEEKAAIGELPHGRGLLGALIHDPRALLLDHLADDPRSVGFPAHHPPMDSFLGVPITLSGKVFGNLYLTGKVGGPFTDDDKQMAFAFALQAAVAVDNMRRYEAERGRADELESLQQAQAHNLSVNRLIFEIERAIRSAPDPRQALDIVCAALGEGLGVDRVMVTTVTADNKWLFGAQWHVLDLPDLPPLEEMAADLVPFVSELAEELWSSTGRLVLHDFSAPEVQSEERARIFEHETGTRAAIMVPIGLGARVIGVIYLLMVHEPRRWTKAEANAVQQVATFVARVIVETDYRTQQSEYIDRLEHLDRQKTDFMSTVSHELRTPLTSISGYLELLQDDEAGELTQEQQRMLEVIDRNTNRLRSLIDDLLVLNQIERGGLKVNVAPVSMRELTSNTGEEMLHLAQSRAIKLDIDAGPEAAIVQGDRGQLQRAVTNIVSNAIKFSHPGGVVTITCTLDEGAHRVLLTCQDRGIGIPANDQAQLFTRFYRASNATAQVIPGTGLGLAILKQIVEDHDGQLRLTSVEGEGTTVTVDLPLSAAAPAGSSQR